MLREDKLSSIKAAIARGEQIAPTAAAIDAIRLEARQLRAEALRHAWRKTSAFVVSLFSTRNLVMPAHRIDVVRGH